jgi:cell wall-associated NlpC family hydrolase
MTEQEQRAAVVAEARSWLATPYHNCADIKGAGVDCGMLLVRVFCDLGLVAPFDPRPYAPDWHLHRDAERYLGWVRSWCGEVSDPAPGDLVVFKYGRCYSHGGIVTESDPLTIVHAFMDVGQVVEEAIHRNPRLKDPARARLFFSFWAKGR